MPSQEQVCRAAIISKGWKDTGLLYTAPGHSRTKYVNLRDAEEDIPALKEMLNAARMGQFNLLVMVDFNRLRDLLQPVNKTLESYGVQIFSINQPTELQPPDKFNPHAGRAAKIMMGLSGIVSDEQIADLQYKYRTLITERTDKGLHSLNVPWGYRVINKKLPAEQIPEAVVILLRVKKLFWDGLNYTEIAALLNSDGIPSPRGSIWRHNTIRQILGEQYYAGKVYFGRLKAKRDYELNRYNIRANPDVEYKPGKHHPVWTWDEHLSIAAEMQKRANRPRRDYVYSGLLWCSVCGERLFLSNSYNGWVCKKYCTGLKNFEVDDLVCAALIDAIKDSPPVKEVKSDFVLSTQLEDLQSQRQRVQHLYKTGSPIYTQEEAEREILKLDSLIKSYQSSEANHELQKARKDTYSKLVGEWQEKIQYLPGLIKVTGAKEMNRLLRQIFKRVVVYQDAHHRVRADGARLVVELWE